MRRFGILAFALIVVLGVVCAVYAAHLMRHGFSTRTAPSGMEKTMAMTMRDMSIPARYKTMKNPVPATAQTIHDGMAHFADHCAICHANNGSGETMFGKGLYPRPPNLAGKDTQSMSDGEIYYTIQNGIRLSGMPAFGEPGDHDTDSWKLVDFIRHLPHLTEAEEIEMSKLNPKAPDEKQEEQQEDDFLNGGPSPAQSSHSNHKE